MRRKQEALANVRLCHDKATDAIEEARNQMSHDIKTQVYSRAAVWAQLANAWARLG